MKFAYGNDLAHAYEQTGEPRYLAAWERLVGSWIRQVPPDHDAAEVTARRILNWIYAWQAFAAAGAELRPGSTPRCCAASRSQVRHVRENLAPERNHRTLELYALLIAALALPELDPGGALLGEAVRELDRNLEHGLPRRRRPHRGLDALPPDRPALVRRRARERPPLRRQPARGLRRPARTRVRLRAPLPPARRPDPGALGRRPGRLLRAARAGRRLSMPRRGARSADFPDGGYFVQRSGWDRDARLLIFDCGPLGEGGHGHYDLLSFEAFAYGRPLVVDPGRFTYSEEPPNLRRWFRGTAAHNTVTVDGLDQTPYTRTRPEGPGRRGPLPRPHDAPRPRRARGRGAQPRLRGGPPAPDRVRRTAATGSIEDHLDAEREHRYDLRFHLAGRRRARRQHRARARARRSLILGADEIALEPGWISPALRRAARGAGGQRRRARTPTRRFVTLLVPVRRDRPRPRSAPCRSATSCSTRTRSRALLGRARPARARTRSTGSARACASSTALDGRHVAARTFPDGESEAAYRARARDRRPGERRCRRSCTRRELGAVLWTFPNDRRLAALPLLADGSPELAELLGRRCRTADRRLRGRALGQRRVPRRGRPRRSPTRRSTRGDAQERGGAWSARRAAPACASRACWRRATARWCSSRSPGAGSTR